MLWTFTCLPAAAVLASAILEILDIEGERAKALREPVAAGILLSRESVEEALSIAEDLLGQPILVG